MKQSPNIRVALGFALALSITGAAVAAGVGHKGVVYPCWKIRVWAKTLPKDLIETYRKDATPAELEAVSKCLGKKTPPVV